MDHLCEICYSYWCLYRFCNSSQLYCAFQHLSAHCCQSSSPTTLLFWLSPTALIVLFLATEGSEHTGRVNWTYFQMIVNIVLCLGCLLVCSCQLKSCCVSVWGYFFLLTSGGQSLHYCRFKVLNKPDLTLKCKSKQINCLWMLMKSKFCYIEMVARLGNACFKF